MTDENNKDLEEEATEQAEDETLDQNATTAAEEDNQEEDSNEDKKDEDTTQDTKTKEEEIGKVKHDLEMSEKRRQDQDKYIGKLHKDRLRATQETEKLKKLQEKADNAFEEGDVSKGRSYVEDAALIKSELETLNAAQLKFENRSRILDTVPNFEELKTDIIEYAKSTGVSDEMLETFKEDPFKFNADNVIQYAKAVLKDRHIKTLEGEIVNLKRQNPQIVKDIKKATEHTTMTNKAGSSEVNAKDKINLDMTSEDIAKMSYEERAILLKNLQSENE